VDREKYYAPIVQLKRQSTYWTVLSILGALFIGLVLARLITRPLSALTEVSRDLARGKFSRRADVGSKNEIGELARAFNAMADDIQVYIQKVEAAAEETKQLFMDSIRAIANALDAKDPYTRGHSERVSAYSMIVGREFGLDERALRVMEISSLLHDVGKIGIEDKILRKPGALTEEEFEIMKTHPPKGAQILGGIPQMREIIPGIKHHHEKWAGGGYPDGLKGEQIPVLARIIGVADAFDAMTTNRPYQRGMTFERASARLNELVMKVYDPTVIDAFNRAFQQGLFEEHRRQILEAKLA
jgi:HD-GYP domain-containing protein (c-di-GMP phosphodiesterase class II)